VYRTLRATEPRAVARVDREVVGFDAVSIEQVIEQVRASRQVVAGQYNRADRGQQE